MIVRRDGPSARLYSRNANEWTARLPAIAAAAERIKANPTSSFLRAELFCIWKLGFPIDGEAAVVGPDGLSKFDELRHRAATRTAILYAFDLIEHDGEDLHDRPLLDRKAERAGLLAIPTLASCSTSTSPRTVPPCSRTLVGLAPRAAPINPVVLGLDQGAQSRERRRAEGE